MRKQFLPLLNLVVTLSLLLTLFVGVETAVAAPREPGDEAPVPASALLDSETATKPTGQVPIMIELVDAPAVLVYADTKARTSSEVRAKRAEATRVARIEQAQEALSAPLAAMGVEEMYRVKYAFNGIAVMVDADNLDALLSLPNVKALHRMQLEYPRTSGSVPLIGAPELWDTGVFSVTGKSVKIGIIDTGVDYLHTDFAGPGTQAAYDSNDTTVITDVLTGTTTLLFPTARVVGGWDFAGDAYNPPDVAASPDPDPMDCYGHGTHVAGIAAGGGVLTDGTPYTGPYSSTLAFTETFKIGPGAAPEAEIYALRVFGCAGGTLLAPLAVDWAVANDLDVINLSLGSNYGTSVTSIALENAAQVLIAVASAGNASDAYYIVGSPSIADHAISVGSSVDAGAVMDGLRVNAPESIADVYPSSNSVAYDWVNAVPVTGTLVYPADQNTGCAAFNITNTQMISGNVVLIDWSHTPDGGHECGSYTRSSNAYAAGAIGVIMAYDLPELDITIYGHPLIPATITPLATGNVLKGALATDDVSVTFDPALAASVLEWDPDREDTVASHSSRGPRRGGSMLKPDIMAPGATIFSAVPGPGNNGESWNGTSMAAPHVAGAMALLYQLYPTWTTEELKALAMNTAVTGLEYSKSISETAGVSRVGAGRIDVARAADVGKKVIAYNATDAGLVSVSFGAPEVITQATATKQITVVNKSTTAATYTVSYEPVTEVPGVDYAFSPTTVVLAPSGTAEITVTMTADATQMRHVVETTHSGHWLTEESGYMVLSDGGPVVNLPIYAAPRPASDMAAVESTLTISGTDPVSITLAGTDIDTAGTGSLAAPPDIVSLVSTFELQTISPDAVYTTTAELDAVMDIADLRYVGVASDIGVTGQVSGTTIYFGIATWGNWDSPNNPEFDIYIDVDRDGWDDAVLFNANTGWWAGDDPNDVFHTYLLNFATGWHVEYPLNGALAGALNTAPFNSNVMVLSVSANDLGLTDANARFDYYVESYPSPGLDEDGDDYCDRADLTDVATYDVANPGLDFGGVTHLDLDGGEIPVAYDAVEFLRARSKGALLLHHHNAEGAHAEVLTVEPGTVASLEIEKSVDVSMAHLGDPVEYTVVVENLGTGDAVGVVVTDTLPAGVVGVSLATTTTVAAGNAVTYTLPVTVTSDFAYASQSIANTASFSYGGEVRSDSAVFTTYPVYFIYLPLVLRDS